jgi:hypothetical protein
MASRRAQPGEVRYAQVVEYWTVMGADGEHYQLYRADGTLHSRAIYTAAEWPTYWKRPVVAAVGETVPLDDVLAVEEGL